MKVIGGDGVVQWDYLDPSTPLKAFLATYSKQQSSKINKLSKQIRFHFQLQAILLCKALGLYPFSVTNISFQVNILTPQKAILSILGIQRDCKLAWF